MMFRSASNFIPTSLPYRAQCITTLSCIFTWIVSGKGERTRAPPWALSDQKLTRQRDGKRQRKVLCFVIRSVPTETFATNGLDRKVSVLIRRYKMFKVPRPQK